MFETILVAIGANLASADGRTPLETCQWAVGRLATLPGLHLRRVSRWFETRPVPASDQPYFINGVALLRGTAEPCELLQSLQAIEAASGRVRSVANAARTLDLDLLALDALVLATPDLILPHPRLHERAFVLTPLIDVLPGWRHPTLDLAAEQLVARVPDRHVKPL